MRRTRSTWKNDGTIPKMTGAMLLVLPSLLFSTSIGYLKMKHQANKGSKIFNKQLQKQGLDREQAAALTKLYLQPSRISTYLRF